MPQGRGLENITQGQAKLWQQPWLQIVKTIQNPDQMVFCVVPSSERIHHNIVCADRQDCEHINDVVKPYDWTYTTDYTGTLLGEHPITVRAGLLVFPLVSPMSLLSHKARNEWKRCYSVTRTLGNNMAGLIPSAPGGMCRETDDAHRELCCRLKKRQSELTWRSSRSGSRSTFTPTCCCSRMN